MNDWGTSDWQWLAALIVTVILGIIGILLTVRLGNRRGKAVFSYSTTPLISHTAESAELSKNLEIRVKGDIIKNPYMTTLSFAYAGPKDIRREQFDDSVVIDMKTAVISTIGDSKNIFQLLQSEDESGNPWNQKVQILPSQIKKGHRWDIKVLTDGKPNPAISDNIADVDIITKTGDELTRAITSGLITTAGILPLPGASITAGIIRRLF